MNTLSKLLDLSDKLSDEVIEKPTIENGKRLEKVTQMAQIELNKLIKERKIGH